MLLGVFWIDSGDSRMSFGGNGGTQCTRKEFFALVIKSCNVQLMSTTTLAFLEVLKCCDGLDSTLCMQYFHKSSAPIVVITAIFCHNNIFITSIFSRHFLRMKIWALGDKKRH